MNMPDTLGCSQYASLLGRSRRGFALLQHRNVSSDAQVKQNIGRTSERRRDGQVGQEILRDRKKLAPVRAAHDRARTIGS